MMRHFDEFRAQATSPEAAYGDEECVCSENDLCDHMSDDCCDECCTACDCAEECDCDDIEDESYCKAAMASCLESSVTEVTIVYCSQHGNPLTDDDFKYTSDEITRVFDECNRPVIVTPVPLKIIQANEVTIVSVGTADRPASEADLDYVQELLRQAKEKYNLGDKTKYIVAAYDCAVSQFFVWK